MQRRPSVRWWSRAAVRGVLMALAFGVGVSACDTGSTHRATVPTPVPSTPASADGSAPPSDLDALCAAWTGYGLTIAAVASAPDEVAAFVEIVSAVFLVESVDAIGAHWPTELVAERSAVLTDLVGPFARRARKAVAALSGVGATDDDLAELRLVWRGVRTEFADTGVLPERLPVPAAMNDLVAAAVAAFTSTVTSFSADPTLGDRRRLLDPVRTPLTEAFVVRWCADVASLGNGVEF